jgi:GGDEF domain-containing protein
MLNLYFYPGLFSLGLAVGVLGLVLLLSLIISYAYEERTLLALAAYLALMVLIPVALVRMGVGEHLVQQTALVIGPSVAVIAQMWLMRGRTTEAGSKIAMALTLLSGLALIVLFALPSPDRLDRAVSYVWFAAVLAVSTYTMVKYRATVGPWIWWFVAGTIASLGVAIAFLSGNVEAEQVYWPQVLMHVLQAPPVYLALVWRSRLINESRLRSSSANVTDPLTGLSTSAVLVERVMRVASRANKTSTVSALFLIEVQNWQGLLAELGEEFNEKLLLEAALRLRRAIGDNDLAARVSGGRFAVVAQGLVGTTEVNALATRLMVSGLRIDSPVLTGIEFKFRIVVSPLVADLASDLNATKTWLTQLTENFNRWPGSHRSRNILLVAHERKKVSNVNSKLPYIDSDITSDAPSSH